MTSLFTLTATTALIMGGAGHPLSTPPDSLPFVIRYSDVGVDNYINPAAADPSTGIAGPVNKRVVVITPEQRLLGVGFDPFFSFDGFFNSTFDKAVAEGQKSLDGCIHANAACKYNPEASTGAPAERDSFVVYGYSQSSTIATLEKRALAAKYPGGHGSPNVSFVLTANGNRPNGGILARLPQGLTIPIVGLTFSGPTPTDTIYPTVDISRQYDGWSDQPTNPLNLLAELNALMGTYYLHQNYDDVIFSQGKLQDTVGDTSYYLIPTPILPLLLPLAQVPLVGIPLAKTLDPVLRVLVEAGYDRTISPGQPALYNPLYFPNPIAFGVNLIVAIPTGLDNGLEDVIGIRPLGTLTPGPYGVGGPPVAIDPTTTQQNAQQLGATSTQQPASTIPSVPAVQPTSQGTTALSAVPSNARASSLPSLPSLTTPPRSIIDMRGGNKVSPGSSPSSTSSSSGANPVRQVIGSVSSALSGLADSLTNGAQKGATTGTASDTPGSSG
jgi:hypothetical protein